MIKLTIPGEPVSASRPRVTGRGFAFIAEPYRSYKKMAHQVIKKQYSAEPMQGTLHVQIKFYRSVQKRVSKVERLRRLSGVHRPTMKPDIDNLFKAVTDACTGVVWKDDNQIVSTKSEKFYSEEPRVEIYVEEL
ncbi:RusA family crossover junction endodeoxyribonuclease [Pediococcus pentosaceus]|uniref:RusA family crossover junction endodeoxyribonuclease n=1 Tax=Pediococcus pentosaceus TaxID=1255 RepID=A0AB73HFE8_PEDPE|nr:RusA family crossover junction endodeoxyribonuclease [Pediococcus pentosaceus]MBF7115198.1 RusA family crossover junction endodeoxyribonuclease [Pediococcus pentosaceus]MDN3207315.1 RusA family crossover junction endodeoxyribonuclease [Pediococcus pentosaceus]